MYDANHGKLHPLPGDMSQREYDQRAETNTITAPSFKLKTTQSLAPPNK
jgi:hypothetical protein